MNDSFDPFPPDARWRCVTDAVMGGVSTATLTREPYAGHDAQVLRGRVRTEFDGGFVQMALDLGAPPAAARGFELDLAGAGHDVGVHLRTLRLVAPWQAWRARVTAARGWRTLRLGWADFAPYRFTGTLVPAETRRIGLVALAFDGRPFDAEVALARLAWWG